MNDPVERRRAVAIAGHTGDVAAAEAALGDEDAAVRGTALGALDRLGHLSTEQLAGGLQDPSPLVRRRAVTVAASRPGDRPPPIVPLLSDDDPVVAETAAWACGERAPAEAGAAEALATLARSHPEHLVREAAVAALGAIGDPIGLPAVLDAMRERATIRRRAVLALAAFDDPAVDEALRTALSDRDRQVRQAAEDLLA